MRHKVSEFFERVGKEKKHSELENHIDLLESGGYRSWISLLNLRFKYLFRSKAEILEELRRDKSELEKDLDYIG